MASEQNPAGRDEPTQDCVERDDGGNCKPPPRSEVAERTTRRVGPFLLLELLRRGGMGEVYRAVHIKLKKIVALKLLPAERLADVQAMTRFRREVQVISGLSHPNIVRFENAGEADGAPYLVMEYVRGVDLERLVRRLGRLPVPDACQLVGQAAIGLQHAHRAGLVHRDVKPANLMLAATGAVKILDLGVALLAEPSLEVLTSPDQVVGNVECLAPEQACHSHAVDARADIYALGCTLFKLLTGRAPFPLEQYGSPQAVVQTHLDQPPPEAAQVCSHIPAGLSALVTRMLAKDPAARYPSAAELTRELARWAEGCDLPALLEKAELAPEPAEAADFTQFGTVDYLKSALSDTTADATASAPNGTGPVGEPSPDSPRRRKWSLLVAVVAALLLFGLIPLIFPRSPAEPPLVLDWSTVDWPQRIVTEREYLFDDLKVTIQLDGNPESDSRHAPPNDSVILHGGLNPPEENLFLDLSRQRPDRSLTVHVTFSEPVKEVGFKLFDVDRSPSSVDQVQVGGWLAGQEVKPSITASPMNQVDQATGTITGRLPSDDQGAPSSAGNAAVRFEEPVDNIRLNYRWTGNEVVGTVQGIGLHDIRFTKAKPICNDYTLDWDRVDWCRADRFRVSAGGVDLAVSFSGDAVQPTRSVRVDVSREPSTPASKRDMALIWKAECQNAHQAATATFDFGRPVADVAFPIHGLSSSSGIADEVVVVGFRDGMPVNGVRVDVSTNALRCTREIAPSVPATAVCGTSGDEKATAQVRFDDMIDRFVLQLSPRESPTGNRRAVNQSPSADQVAKTLPHASELSLGNIRFRLGDHDRPRETLDGRTARAIVPATANPWTAGLDWQQMATDDVPTDQRAVRVQGLRLTNGMALTFSVSGSVREQSGVIERTADGGHFVQYPGDPKRGLAAAEAPVGGLVGVLLGQPTATDASAATPPARFGSAMTDETIAPALREVFFIGDGKTSGGKAQRFVVPQGASELYLGIMDDRQWKDNVGWLAVDVAACPFTKARPSEPVPAPIDLLALVSPERDITAGDGRRDDGGLVLEAGTKGAACVQIPFTSPPHGDVALCVQRLAGTGSFGVGLAAGRGRFIATLDAPLTDGIASYIVHTGQDGLVTSQLDRTQRLPLSVPVQVRVSVSTNQINVSCENQVINQCNCEHASLQSRRDLESSYPHTIFLVVRAGTFRITQMTLTPRGGVAEPIVFSNPDRSPERAAAELAIWKGGAVRVLVGGQPSRSIDHLRDLPAQVTLFDIGIREPRHGMVLKDRDLAIFARASQLQSFDLSHSNVSDAALLHLIGLKKLRTLDLRRTRISGKGLAHVARIEPLETLALDLTSIGDADLPVLYGLRHLRQLSLAGTNVSPEGRKELQRNMPQVKLEEIGVGTPLAGQAELPPEASPAQPQQASTQTPSRKLRCPATGHYYQRIDTAMSWHEAKQHCESLGGHLATITSAEENDFVYKNFAADHVCWLGATDEAEEGKWTWVTGEPFAFQNWFPGNPGDEEDCLVLGNSPDVVENGQRYFYRFGPQWNDHAAHGKYHGPAITYPLCEWDGEE